MVSTDILHHKKWVSGSLHISAHVTRVNSTIITTFSLSDPSYSDSTKPPPAYVLHWGAAESSLSRAYIQPPASMLPPKTDPRPGKASVRTDFVAGSGSGGSESGDTTSTMPILATLEIPVEEAQSPNGIVFLVYKKGENGAQDVWFKNQGGTDFYVDLKEAWSEQEIYRRKAEIEQKQKEELERLDKEQREKREKEIKEEQERKVRQEKMEAEKKEKEARSKLCLDYLEKAIKGFRVIDSKDFSFGADGDVYMRAIHPDPNPPKEGIKPEDIKPGQVVVATSLSYGGVDILLHWGIKKSEKKKSGWNVPPEDCWPPNTTKHDGGLAVQTVFTPPTDDPAFERILVTKIQNLPQETLGFFSVLHIPDADKNKQWLNKPGGGDMYLTVSEAPPIPGLGNVSKVAAEMAQNIIEREMEYDSWTLMHRYGHASHLINSMMGTDEDAWACLYIWLRYSQLRVLDWQRNYNTQPRQLASAQMSFVTHLANRFKDLSNLRWVIRMSMSCVGRGGSGDLGQKIRDDILVILRHNRGWGHGSMMEEWHQKLHNNTNPDDVIICEALLAFWRGNGNLQAYWDHLNGNGVTAERMARYEQPIRAQPDFPGHIKDTIIWELEKYLGVLRAVHLGTDLRASYDHCRHYMSGDARGKCDGYFWARDSNHQLLDQIWACYHARQSITNQILGGCPDDQRRDLLFLDIALESDIRRTVESGNAYFDDSVYSHLSGIRGACLSLALSEDTLETASLLRNVEAELARVQEKISSVGESRELGLRAAAGFNNSRNTLTTIVDRFHKDMDALSRALGSAFHAEHHIVDIFVEEAVRGSSAFVLSAMLRKAEPAVRRIAHLGPWSIISPHFEETVGPVRVYNYLRESQGEPCEKGTVIIANKCEGNEDVPDGVSYVIIGSTVDVLSHVAVRARNEHHGLIACLDSTELEKLRGLEGSTCKAVLEGETFKIQVVEHSLKSRQSSQNLEGVLRKVKSKGLITKPSGTHDPPEFVKDNSSTGVFDNTTDGLVKSMSKDSMREASGPGLKRITSLSIMPEQQLNAAWAIRPSAYNDILVGTKSINLQKLLAMGLPDWIHVPTSVTIPNGAMKKVFNDPANAELKKEYKDLTEHILHAKDGDLSLCVELRELIMKLELPDGLAEALRGVLDELECEDIDESMPGAWEAVKGVWASMWNERAYLARKKLHLISSDVDMAVLCQKIVDADYAFVIHTHNPVTGARDEIYAEAVVGLGETLVSNAPGQALGFTMKKDEESPVVKSFPSKQYALKGGKFIFRSDSNTEDLEGFAGAGLHDSIPIENNVEIEVDYANERLVNDDNFREELMRNICKIGIEVENLMGGFPQDIEGCYMDGKYFIVQARPQV